jgi:hypothetical protein
MNRKGNGCSQEQCREPPVERSVKAMRAFAYRSRMNKGGGKMPEMSKERLEE